MDNSSKHNGQLESRNLSFGTNRRGTDTNRRLRIRNSLAPNLWCEEREKLFYKSPLEGKYI